MLYLPFKQKTNYYIQLVLPFLNRHKISLFLLFIALLPFLVYIGINIYTKTKTSYILSTHERQQKNSIKKQREDYQKLIDTQSKQKKNDTSNEDTKKRKALGSYTLNVFFVKPASLQSSLISGLIQKLESKDDKDVSSLFFINTFYKKSAKNYDIRDFNLDLKFHGPYNLVGLEKVGDMALYWGKDPFSTLKLQDSFDKLITDNKILLNDKDVTIFLYFDDSFSENSSEKEGRFYEHKKFRSFAMETTGKAYVNIYRLDTDFSKKVTEIVAHEVLHLFGANDKYEESESVTRICAERGRGDLDLRPRVPQKTADIMCMYIEKENDKFTRGSFSDNTLSINQLTAKEIGWRDSVEGD